MLVNNTFTTLNVDAVMMSRRNQMSEEKYCSYPPRIRSKSGRLHSFGSRELHLSQTQYDFNIMHAYHPCITHTPRSLFPRIKQESKISRSSGDGGMRGALVILPSVRGSSVSRRATAPEGWYCTVMLFMIRCAVVAAVSAVAGAGANITRNIVVLLATFSPCRIV